MEVNYVACVKRNAFVDSAVLRCHSDKPTACTNLALIKGNPDSMVCPLPLLNNLKNELFIYYYKYSYGTYRAVPKHDQKKNNMKEEIF